MLNQKVAVKLTNTILGYFNKFVNMLKLLPYCDSVVSDLTVKLYSVKVFHGLLAGNG